MLLCLKYHSLLLVARKACFLTILDELSDLLLEWLFDQAQVEGALRICWRVLHLQYLRLDFLGDQTQRFWCQHDTSCCCCCPHHFFLSRQVFRHQPEH